jgi:hypothetical protein
MVSGKTGGMPELFVRSAVKTGDGDLVADAVFLSLCHQRLLLLL